MLKPWSQLTPEEQATFGDGCGPGTGLLGKLIPELYFNADCRQHDYYYARGGDLFNKIEADTMFFAHMVKSVNTRFTHWIDKVVPFLASLVYFVAVSTFGLFWWFLKKR